MKRKCLTPDTFYFFRTNEYPHGMRSATFSVSLPSGIEMTNHRAKLLEKALHDAAEKVLSPLFKIKEGK